MYFVYIIQCKDGSLYTGTTNDIERRFSQHKNKKGGHYTASHEVKKVIYTEKFENKSEALKREIQFKGWKRDKKLAFIESKTLSLPKT